MHFPFAILATGGAYVPIPTKTKIILMQSIDPTTVEEASGTYETVTETELEVRAPALESVCKDPPHRSQLGTPATLIFPGNAIPANVRELAIAHLRSMKQPDDSSVMAVSKGEVPIVKNGAASPSRGIPSWVSIAAAAAIFVGVTTAALTKSTLFRAPPAANRAAATQPMAVSVPVVDLPVVVNAPAVPDVHEPVAIILSVADLKPELADPPTVDAPKAEAPKANAPKSSLPHAHAHAPAKAVDTVAVAPAPAKPAVAAKLARPAPVPKAPVAAPAPPARSSDSDELAKIQAQAKQQLGEALP